MFLYYLKPGVYFIVTFQTCYIPSAQQYPVLVALELDSTTLEGCVFEKVKLERGVLLQMPLTMNFQFLLTAAISPECKSMEVCILITAELSKVVLEI